MLINIKKKKYIYHINAHLGNSSISVFVATPTHLPNPTQDVLTTIPAPSCRGSFVGFHVFELTKVPRPIL